MVMNDVDPTAPQAPLATETAARPPERQGPFGPVGPGARLTFVWASPIAQIVMHVVALVPAIILFAIALVPIVAATGLQPNTDGTLGDFEIIAIMIVAAIQFPVWALFAILWTRGFERRSLASAGVRGPSFTLRNYGIGLAVGFVIAAALTAFSPFIEPAAVGELAPLDASRFLGAGWLLTFAGVIVFFLIQSACEEIAFRGWMMSSIAARRGLVMAVAVNTITFGLMHIQYFAFGLVTGTLSVVAVGCVGLFLSVWAIRERSVAGVCGIHGAFNTTGIIISLVAMAATDPDATAWNVLTGTIRQATALEGEGSSAGAVLQIVLFAAPAIWLWTRLRASRPDFR